MRMKKMVFTGMMLGAGMMAGGDLNAAEKIAVPTFIKACAGDIKKYCGAVVPGDGRLGQCLFQHMSELSEPCRKFAMHGGAGHELASLTDIDRYYAAQKSVSASVVKAEVKHVDAAEAAALAGDPKTFILDVRTKEEYADGRIKNSLLVPIDELSSRVKDLPADKNQKILVYCKAGGRSRKAAGILKELGYANINNLKGGITAWEKAGKEIVK